MAGQKVNLNELAGFMGVTRQTATAWLNDGMPYVQKADRGNAIPWVFDTADVRIWREKIAQEKIEQKYRSKITEAGEMDIEEAKRREAVAKAQLAEIDLAKERGLLVNIDDMLREMGRALANARAQLLSIPNRVAGTLAFKDEKEITQILEEENNTILEELNKYEHRYSDNK